MAISTRKRIRHLVGASCAAALLAGTVGMASAEAVPQKATEESSSAAPCTAYHYDANHERIWDPPGCTPP
jgi:hypothetical protein